MNKQDMKIISVGGSIVIPKDGFDTEFLKKFRSLILKHTKKGSRFILVVGGGTLARNYQSAAKAVTKLTNEDLDWIGIHSTIMNAQLVKYLFKGYAHSQIITDPRNKIKSTKPIIIAAGWKPGWSTDTDAVFLAKAYGAREVINLSNIEYVYDKDPSLYKNAKKVEAMDWQTFRDEIVGHEWKAGTNAPFDPIASKKAQKLGLKVSILRGTDLKEVDKAISGKKFKGTIIY